MFFTSLLSLHSHELMKWSPWGTTPKPQDKETGTNTKVESGENCQKLISWSYCERMMSTFDLFFI